MPLFFGSNKKRCGQLYKHFVGLRRGHGTLHQLPKELVRAHPLQPAGLGTFKQSLPAARASFPLRYLGLSPSIWKLNLVDFQFLVDKAVGKLTTYEEQNITIIGRTALLKSVITSQLVYPATPLIIPPTILLHVNKLERAFLGSGAEKTTGPNAR